MAGNGVTRRVFMGTAMAAVAGTSLALAKSDAPQPAPGYAAVRGFNYQPSYGSHGLETWGEGFDIQLIRRELLLGRKYFPKMNTIRLWLSYDAFIRWPEAMPQRFHRVIDLAGEVGVRFIPTLFNGWHSCPDFGGISVEMLGYWGGAERFEEAFCPYIDAIVKPHTSDSRILLWDLCNEPFNSAAGEGQYKTILDWLGRVRSRCNAMGVAAPIAVGAVPSIDFIRMVEPLSDVITFHPYFTGNLDEPSVQQFEAFLDQVVTFGMSVNKPLLATETGWGALDDQKRAETLAVELGGLARRNIGFTAHLLHHTLVADGHRPEYGPISGAGYMAFIEKDGSLRPQHDIFNNY